MKRIKRTEGRIWQAMHSDSEESRALIETLRKAQRKHTVKAQDVQEDSDQ